MKYKKIIQKPHCCTAACLEMILNRNKIKNNGQEYIAYELGLVVPPNERYLFKKHRDEEKPLAGYGTQIQKKEYSIERFFDNNNINLYVEYKFITDIELVKKFLNKNINNDIIICIHCGTLYDSINSNWGHMILFESIDKNIITILDPSENRDYENIPIGKLIDAIKIHGKENGAGFWLIKNK